MPIKRLLKVRKKKELVYPEHCPNCTHPLTGKYCSSCGQSVRDFHRPIWSIIKDVVGDLAAFDNRLIRTLIPLLVNPGKLTHEFMKGRRVSYMPPFKMYLFLTFIAFFLLSYNHKPDPLQNADGHLSIKGANGEVLDIEKYFEDDEDEDDKDDDDKVDSLAVDSLVLDTIPLVSEVDTALTKKGVVLQVGEGESNVSKDSKDKMKQLIDLYKLNPGMIIDNAFKKLSQTLFVILPLFALLLALLYIRRRRYFLEHLLISVNFHSYIFLMVILSELLLMINWSVTTQLAVYLYLTIPIRLFLGMKFYYKQGWIKTFFKFVFLSFFYNILLISGLVYSLWSLVE